MKNLITFLFVLGTALFITSCSDQADLTSVNDTDDTSSLLQEITEEGDKIVKSRDLDLESVEGDESKMIDATKIIQEFEKNTVKNVEGKSIATVIFDRTYSIHASDWFDVTHWKSNMKSYYTYTVKVIPVYGDPDVSIWGYDKHSYNKWRRVRGATYYDGYTEHTWYKKSSFYSREEKGVIGVFADRHRNAKFRIIITKIS